MAWRREQALRSALSIPPAGLRQGSGLCADRPGSSLLLRLRIGMASEDGAGVELERFVLLARGARGKACVALLEKVLRSEKVHVFGELLDVPTVKEVGRAGARIART